MVTFMTVVNAFYQAETLNPSLEFIIFQFP